MPLVRFTPSSSYFRLGSHSRPPDVCGDLGSSLVSFHQPLLVHPLGTHPTRPSWDTSIDHKLKGVGAKAHLPTLFVHTGSSDVSLDHRHSPSPGGPLTRNPVAPCTTGTEPSNLRPVGCREGTTVFMCRECE